MRHATVPLILAISLTVGCQLRKPFEGTVIAAGADGSKVKNGIFATTHPQDDGDAVLFVDSATAKINVNYFGAAASLALTPLQIDDEKVGQVTFDLLTNGPSEGTDLVIVSWVDSNDNGQWDVSFDGDSELGRTITRLDVADNRTFALTFYSYQPNNGDPFYTATGFSPENNTNYIISEDILVDWMAVLPANFDPPLDTDGDGLSDATENRIGTSPDAVDSDGDGIDDLTEVGDPAAPRDSDGDGIIDALDFDSDNDGVDDATEGVVDNDGDGVPAYRDADEQPT